MAFSGVFAPVLAKQSKPLSLVDAGRDRILSVRITTDLYRKRPGKEC